MASCRAMASAELSVVVVIIAVAVGAEDADEFGASEETMVSSGAELLVVSRVTDVEEIREVTMT